MNKLPDKGSYGIVIYNFSSDDDKKLNVNVGEPLHLKYEDEYWYYGNLVHQYRIEGVIPKSYVKIIDCEIENDETSPSFTFPDQPPIVYEITLVLREWSQLWKNLYIKNREQFDKLRKHIWDLIHFRSKIISGTLPVDELKEVTCDATKVIAVGNKILQLDLVVRDANGNTINPLETSTITLFDCHQNAAELLNNKTECKEIKPTSRHFSHIFVVSVNNFTCKMTEDGELRIFLYDAKEGRAITENFVVKWSKEGLMSDLDQINSLKVMFTDLGKKDLDREKVFLVCYAIRIGAMEPKELDRRSSTTTSPNPKSTSAIPMRRACGVAAKEVTDFLSKRINSDLETEYSVPIYNCEKDALEQTLRKIMNKEESKNEHRATQSMFIGLQLLHGDIKQVRDENPHLVLGNVNIARKMGFPEVILPGDIRNDLYLTLKYGEFSKGNKKSDKNIQVTVTVCNAKGQAIPGVIFVGDAKRPSDEYHSVIYYHEPKPQWFETFKVAMPIDEFKTSHIKFTFKHRSSNEAKDKSERPFAFAYVNLMQKDGTTLCDDTHNLHVYKYDYKKFGEGGVNYLELASIKVEDPSKGRKIEDVSKNPVIPGISLSNKDTFTIASNVCSTKLTQNVNLLGLLNWTTNKNQLENILENLMQVEGEEIVKFLQDILDTLFAILMDMETPTSYDVIVFDCLLHITGTVSTDWRYQHFEPVLNLYIKDNFSATLAYQKMLIVLCDLIASAVDNQKVFKTMKSFQYIMRFITQSRLLHMKIYDDSNDNAAMIEFEQSMDKLLTAFIALMSRNDDHLLREQGACLKYLPGAIPDILKVYSAQTLSEKLCTLFESMPSNRLIKQKVMTMNEIVKGPLFKDAECRRILLPNILLQIKYLMEDNQEDTQNIGSQTGRRTKPTSKSVAKVALVLGIPKLSITQHTGSTCTDEMEICMNILGDILTLLFHIDPSDSSDSIEEIIRVLLRPISDCYIKTDKETTQAKQLAAMLVDIFRQMTEAHYTNYISSSLFSTNVDTLHFIVEIMTIFKEFVDPKLKIFPEDWCEMKMLQNSVILKALRFFSYTIRDNFSENFNQQAWNNFFECAISYMAQPGLQLEEFTPNKQLRIIKRYKDMRREMGFEVRQMWYNLGPHRRRFVPGLVENILEMTLIPETELRKATIPIFFDMMQCEYFSSSIEFESFGDTCRNSKNVKGNFDEFEREMIIKLDALFEGGCGDEDYKNRFHDIMIDHCSQHARLNESGTIFVKTLTSLMERLLLYRITMNNDNKENKMLCIENLLHFYYEIKRKEMYIRYVYKLYDLHLELGNHTEAGYTLNLHCDLLEWSNSELPIELKSNKHDKANTHLELKEQLYADIIENYDKGEMWESAVEKTKELIKQYEELYYYDLLSPLHKKMADYYRSIMTKVRGVPEYFRVAYYGNGFPKFLQNRVFIYRGSKYERLAEFINRICREFPKAEIYQKLTPPDGSCNPASGQLLQINKVDPIDEDTNRFNDQLVSEQIGSYYKWNNVKKFQFSRRIIQKDPYIETPNEFGNMWLERTILITEHSFPHILCWYPVKSEETILLTPVQVAIETMENSNMELRSYYKRYMEDSKILAANDLGLRLKGILEPSVMGGITNYEQYFFTPEYLAVHPEEAENIEKLKELIAEQIPLLELGVEMHKTISSEALLPLHKLLEECYSKQRNEVQAKYGVRDCIQFKTDVEVRLRRANKKNGLDHKETDSPHHHVSNVGTRSRVSSITRAQVQSFKNLTSSFNFSTSTTPQNDLSIFSKTPVTGTKSMLLSPSKSITGTPYTLKKNKIKEKRRSSKTESTLSTSSITTQWYTSDVESSIIAASMPGNGTQIYELRQELTPKRPLRSEVEKEKRLSRPSSGQFSRPSSLSINLRATSSSGTSSNRDSIGTTDSSVSEEDLPPPLPSKLRDSATQDAINIPLSLNHPLNYDFARLLNESPVGNLNKEAGKPPTPPPKPPKRMSHA